MKKILMILFFCNFVFANSDFVEVKKSCKNNDLESCYLLAWMHYVENDDSNTITKEKLNYLCNEKKHAKSCFDLGNSLYKVNSEKYLRMACELGYLESCYTIAKIEENCPLMVQTLQNARKKRDCKTLALIYTENECVGKNEDVAIQNAKIACKNQDNKACELYYRLVFKKNVFIKEILEKAEKKCENDISNCFWLIQIYRFGFLGEKKDYKKAANIAINNCKRGNARACFTLADLEQRGYKSDFEEVKKAMQEGCDLGNKTMCNFIKNR